MQGHSTTPPITNRRPSKRFVSEHFFTLLAILVSVLVLVAVPQVNATFRVPPSKHEQRIGFLIFAFLTAGWLLVTLVRFFDLFRRWSPKRGRRRWSTLDFPLRWPTIVDHYYCRLGSGFWAYAIPVVLVATAMAFIVRTSSHTQLPLFGAALTGSIRMACVGVIAVCLWLFFGLATDPSDRDTTSLDSAASDTVKQEGVRTRVGEAIGFLITMSVVGELVWICSAYQLVPLASLRLYSIWAIFQILTMTIVIAGVIDFLDTQTKWPWRILSALLIVASVMFARPKTINDQRVRPADDNTVASPVSISSNHAADVSEAHPWYELVHRRLDKMPEGPVVLVSASGGGSRAAIFTAMVLEYLDQKPMRLPEIIELASEPNRSKDGSTWGEHILWISSVSGGTLASGRYIDLQPLGLARHQYDAMGQNQSIDGSEWISRAKTYTQSLIPRFPRDKPGLDKIQSLAGALDGVLRDLDSGLIQLSGDTSGDESDSARELIERMLRSRFVDEMGMDYMAPIYRGFLQPLETRGEGLYGFWNDQFNWRNWSRGRFSDRWDAIKQPLWFVNVTDIDHGRRVIIGCPELPRELLPANGILPVAANPTVDTEQAARTRVHQPYTFSAMDPDQTIDLSVCRLARLSSNFPFGFRPAVVQLADPSPLSQRPTSNIGGTPRRIHLLDGGIVDNTGIDSVHALILSLHRHASQFAHPQAINLLGRLRRRGVIFVEIDSGARPDLGASGNGGFAWLSQPIAALSKASYTTALHSSESRLAELKRHLSLHPGVRLLETLIEPDFTVGVSELGVQLQRDDLLRIAAGVLTSDDPDPMLSSFLADRLTCHIDVGDDAQVMTAFALTPEDKARILTQFLIEADKWDASADRMSADLRLIRDDEPNQDASGRRDRLDTLVTLLDVAAKSVDQLHKESGQSQAITRERLARRIETPLAAFTLAGLIAKNSPQDADVQAIVRVSQELQRLVELSSQGKTDELLVYPDPNTTAGVSLTDLESPTDYAKVVKPDARTTQSPTVSVKTAPSSNVWSKIVRDAKRTSRMSDSPSPDISPDPSNDPTPSRSEVDRERMEGFEMYKMRRDQNSMEIYRTP
ncbi:MAG: patatin-like phospholipase family protein [Planctomycetota bacterium]